MNIADYPHGFIGQPRHILLEEAALRSKGIIFQEKISELMAGLDFAHAYLDDL
jgi:hypothetical protein